MTALFSFLILFVHAADLDLLQKATAPYQTSGVVESETEKTTVSPFDSKPKTTKGKLYLSKGKFRWENAEPEKLWTIFDGTTLWSVRFADPDFPGKNHVMKMKFKEKDRDKTILLHLLSPDDLQKEFTIEKSKELFLLKPKVKGLAITDIKLKVLDDCVDQISYKDDVDNKVTIQFSKPQKTKKIPAHFFSYQPDLKKDEVETQ